MQEEHTEHIDQLDNYYKETLDNISVNPPADMWNRITNAMDEQQKPKGFWISKKWLIPLIALLFLSFVVGYFIVNTQKKEDTHTEKKVTPTVSKPTNTETQEENTTINTTQKAKDVSSSASSKNKNTTSVPQSTTTIVTEENNTQEQNNTTITETPTVTPIAEPEPIVTPTTEKEVPKKKLGFREKHTEALKDSVRPLFVPKK